VAQRVLVSAEQIESIEAGIDWVTFTAPRKGGETALRQFGRRIIEEQRLKGSRVAPWRAEGYHGEASEQCASGSRADTDYLRISGSLAGSRWCEIPECSGHPTRLDVQTTLTLKESRRSLGSTIWRERKSNPSPLRGRPPRRVCSQGSCGLWLGTVGTRTARSYLRVYDKGVEKKTHPAGFRWRIELEAKQSLARGLWAELQSESDAPAWCQNTCERAIRAVDGSWPLVPSGNTPPLPPVPPKELESVQRTKAWLSTSVRPCVERLLEFCDTDELLELLGLDAYALPITSKESQS
jgi:hypothetical protein